MTASEQRSDANDSVFYYVIRLEAVRGGSNVSIEGHFGGFGKFEPRNVVDHRVDPQKALPYLTTRVLSYCASESIHE